VIAEPDRVSVEIDERAVAWITVRSAEGSLAIADLIALEGAVRLLERAAGDRRARSAVILSDPAERFLGELDLEELERVGTPEGAAHWVRTGLRVLRRLDLLPIPTFAAIQGDCSGPGLSVALACTYRVGVGKVLPRLALREGEMGLLPFWGASVRLGRLIGVHTAAELLTTSRWLEAEEAMERGLLDAVTADAGDELSAFAAEHGRRRSPHSRSSRVRPWRSLGASTWGSGVFRRPKRPGAPDAGLAADALQMIQAGKRLPLADALEREADLYIRWLGEADLSPYLHLARQERRARRLPSPALSGTIEEVGVLGADDASIALAALLARHGLSVRLKAERRDAARRALSAVRSALGPAVHADLQLEARLASGAGFGGFGALDLVLSAGDASAGADLLAAEEHVRDGCALVAIDPAHALSTVQGEMRLPNRLAGLRFPQPRLDGAGLVEIVRGPRTELRTVQRLRALAIRMKGIPVTTSDAAVGLVDRCVVALVLEAVWLLQEGAGWEEIETAARSGGIEPSPLARAEQLGFRWVESRALALLALGHERFRPPALLERLASGPGSRPAFEPARDPGVWTPQGLLERLTLRATIEALHGFDEGLVRDAGMVDLALVLLGVAPRSTGGLLFPLQRDGARAAASAFERLGAAHGPRFTPPRPTDRVGEPRAGQGAPGVL
jgi:enoyl-CoA hydratase/carnithine racemase/3-hydroxyacyl-CoA dehydrogenase